MHNEDVLILLSTFHLVLFFPLCFKCFVAETSSDFKISENAQDKNNWMTKWDETNWKSIENEHLPVNTLFESL